MTSQRIGDGVYLLIYIGWGVEISSWGPKMGEIFQKLWVDLIVYYSMLPVVALASSQKIQPQRHQRLSRTFTFVSNCIVDGGRFSSTLRFTERFVAACHRFGGCYIIDRRRYCLCYLFCHN